MVSRAPPALGRVRLADLEDAYAVIDLVNTNMSKNFRVYNITDIVTLIENCVLSICQLDVKKTVVGFMALKDYPLIPSVHPSAWEPYIWQKYKTTDLCARNTLFVHLICWNTAYARDLVDNMLHTVFMHDVYLQYICILKSLVPAQMLVPGQSRCEASFKRTQSIERGISGDRLPALYIADRKDVCPPLRIRRAVEEDNDDIVPLLDRHSKMLAEMYGEFYVSELISRHPESARILIVCEHKDLAVGVMALNTQINFEALEEAFEISPYAGFRHLDSVPTKGSDPNLIDIISSYYIDVSALAQPQAKKSGVNYSCQSFLVGTAYYSDLLVTEVYKGHNIVLHFLHVRQYLAKQVGLVCAAQITFETPDGLTLMSGDYPLFPPNFNESFFDMLEDDEEDDFEIVNIEPELLCFPSIIAPESNKSSFAEDTKEGQERFGAKSKSMTTPAVVSQPQAQHEPVRYSGKPNAFLLELCAIQEHYDERYSFDMLEATFTLFPDRAYCLLCIPSNHVSFPLLEHFTLVTPLSNKLRFINESLYVAHINTIRGTIKVRRGEHFDVPNLFNIFEHTPRRTEYIDMFVNSLEASNNNSYMLLCEDQPIGCVIIGPLESNATIRAHFKLLPESRRPDTDASILAAVVSPVLEPHYRWYMRDVLRQSQYTTLFWSCQHIGKGDNKPVRNLMSLVSRMTPCAPRRLVPNLSGNKRVDVLFKQLPQPMALWILERPLTMMPKVDVNNSIVVVGASRTGMAFVETLLLGSTADTLTFTNITLVSLHGLPAIPESHYCRTCLPECGSYTDARLKSIPFNFYLDVIPNIMVGINRKQKYITLLDGNVKYYDELVLTCGLQFQHPHYLSEALEIVKEQQKGKPCERMLMDNPKYQPDRVPPCPILPDNVSVINSIWDANSFFKKLPRLIADSKQTMHELSPENPFVVYGDCVEAYSTMTALLEFGIEPACILFVEDFPPDDPKALRINCFNDDLIDFKVRESMKTIGIRDLRECKFDGWHYHDSFHYVENIYLMSPFTLITQPCFHFIYFGQKAINIHAFRAINECGLVYDGGLIVNPYFETNDPYVFGAGTCVKYSRCLYADRKQQRYYNSEDVGRALGEIFLKRFNPFIMAMREETKDYMEIFPKYSSSICFSTPSISDSIITGKCPRWEPVMTFESPISIRAILPGQLYYMKMRKPGIEVPLQVQKLLPHQGHVLVTEKNQKYFRLHLNVFHCIEGLTCLTKHKFSSDILLQLYGMHEAFFDKLLERYKRNEIDDLYTFFTQPWMGALYQEVFDDLMYEINAQQLGTVYDLVKSRFDLMGDKGQLRSRQTRLRVDSDDDDDDDRRDIPEHGFGPMDAPKLGTFKGIIQKFFKKTSSYATRVNQRPADIPSECGQSAAARSDAAAFWQTVRGSKMVDAHLDRFLNLYRASNPQYFLSKHSCSFGAVDNT